MGGFTWVIGSGGDPVKPFIWRRGLSDMMLSDNPTNFVGPRNVLKELQTVFLKNKERLTGYAGRPEVYPPRGNSGEIRQASAGAKLHRSQLWRGDHTRAPHHRAALSCAAASGSGESSNKPRPAYLKRWQQLSVLRLHFWSKHYMLSLQQRT